MGWRDRDYNRGREAMTEFFGNPGSIFNLAVPFGTWFGSQVRLHFWLLLFYAFMLIAAFRTGAWVNTGIAAALLLVFLLIHEFGHRLCAEWTGGRHFEFVLWPAGGLIPPHTMPQPWPLFVANVGGMLANLLCLSISGALFILLTHQPHYLMALINPFYALFSLGAFPIPTHAALMGWPRAMALVYAINMTILMVNFLPFYIFDGAHLLQAILWPWTGLYQSINVTCIIGMVVAVPLFLLSFYNFAFLAMVFWVLMFAGSFMRRQQLRAAGPEDMQDAISYSASLRDVPQKRRRKISRRWFKKSRRRASQEQRDQALIDMILDKVHAHGLHSLSWREKRVLRRATARQRDRDRDFAEKL